MIMKMRFLFSFLLAAAAIVASAQSAETFTFGTKTNPNGDTFEVDRYGFIINGKHQLGVMGEIHYSRVPEHDWLREIQKMKAGGITVISTYCFWNHHEAEEGKWDWSGNKNLHKFLETCRDAGMPVVLRIGPFCHGEVYQGGIPEWLTDKAKNDPKQYKSRSLAPGFMAATQRLYSNIYAQACDMLWKNGGTVVGVQIENECRGPWAYYMALKEMAVQIGFDVPFYTRTGWPKLNGKEEFGKLLPLYGDYADGFWDRVLTDMPGDYKKAFVMKDTRVSGVIATETFGTNQDTKMDAKELQYPYLTCELGGGMMPSYHRRINMSGNEALPLAICKLGSGSNLLGYYMYHGGTNPLFEMDGQPRTMAETQKTAVTNYNDMPYMTYDFQCPLGEMGQPNVNSFHQLRLLHQFLADWGEEVSTMDVDTLSDHYARRGCFEFYNDYVRILNEDGICYVRPVGMPFLGHSITADAQPLCKIGNTLYLYPIKGRKPAVWVDGKKYAVKLDKELAIKDIRVCILSEQKAMRAFKTSEGLVFAETLSGIIHENNGEIVAEMWNETNDISVGLNKIREASKPRTITMGSQKVAEMPTNEDFNGAAVWRISLESLTAEKASDAFLQINYEGDCARVYADGHLVADNFWNGMPMLVRLSDLYGKNVELRILPLSKDAPIYLQKEQKAILDSADGDSLLKLREIKVIQRETKGL